MNKRVLIITSENCTGCHLCELACSSTKEGLFRPIHSRIKVITDGLKGWSSPVVCVQCEDPLCLKVCPVGALHKSQTAESDYYIEINREVCTACHQCVAACPFGVIEYIKDIGIIKCDLCGGEPICVDYCFYDCLKFLELSEDQYQKRLSKLKAVIIKNCRELSKKESSSRRAKFSSDISKL